MLLRPQWKRLRRHWVCYGIGTICASTLAFTGCSRAPMSRFKELTSAPATETAEQPSETRSVSTEQPDPRDAVATQKSSPSTQEGRVSIVGDGGRRGFKQYREGYADLRNRLLNRGGTESGDPFLEAEAEAARDFPATDSLSPRRTDERAPTADGPVARADLNRDSKAAVGVASMQRTLPQDDLRRSPTPQGVATTGRQEGVVRTKPQEKQTSRLEQLRAELRAQQAGDASDADSGVGIVRAGDSNRGTVLST
ncbi:MAG: hypothetical protein KDA75_22825, partial [Planctomycetaceae bacterium]|nr:hypothetical protein [Planctomycetaceae bacterium]